MAELDPSQRFDLRTRASGVLVHLTSLPGPRGIGDLGSGARAFIDFLARARQRWWQMLPVHPTGSGASPYSGVSCFAGHALLLSLDDLRARGLLEDEDLPLVPSGSRVDYAEVGEQHGRAIRVACRRYLERHGEATDELAEFRERAAFWLPDYALFMALRARMPDRPWTAFDAPLANREPDALERARHTLREDILHHEVEQLLFDSQWRALSAYAHERGVGLIGDVPIFVAHDSADVWAHQRVFQLDARGEPTHVSGVPPDLFSTSGQRWGTPLYRWDVLHADDYRFWVERMRVAEQRFDVIRLDHFIGFTRYWTIPASEETAVVGRWVDGPKDPLFEVLARELGGLPCIAEDLGVVTDEVRALRDRLGLPGMRVLQFAFGGDEAADEHLPHRYVPNLVAYTATHDLDTSLGWWEDPGSVDDPVGPVQKARERQALVEYVAGPGASTLGGPVHWEMIRTVCASVANTVIVPLQDLLGLGSEARMNKPGRAEGNWAWRASADALSDDLAETLAAYARTYGRAPRRDVRRPRRPRRGRARRPTARLASRTRATPRRSAAGSATTRS